MFKINRKIEYALISLKHMSCKNPGQLTTAKEICDIYQTPFDPTSRVLQIMAQHDILLAEQGAKGGYQIIKNLTKLTLADLCDIIIGPIEIANCFQGDYSHCAISHSCQIIAPMLILNDYLNKLLKEMTIAELIEYKHQEEKHIREKVIKVMDSPQ